MHTDYRVTQGGKGNVSAWRGVYILMPLTWMPLTEESVRSVMGTLRSKLDFDQLELVQSFNFAVDRIF